MMSLLMCGLCKGVVARVNCAADQASLCWNCDAIVHSANFLVARHSRNLLCTICYFRTPWLASGANIMPTYSACQRCMNAGQEAAVECKTAAWSPPEEERSDTEITPGGSGAAFS